MPSSSPPAPERSLRVHLDRRDNQLFVAVEVDGAARQPVALSSHWSQMQLSALLRRVLHIVELARHPGDCPQEPEL